MTTEQLHQNTGLLCFLLLARHHHIDLTLESMSHRYNIHDGTLDPLLLLRMAKDQGFKSKRTQLTWRKLFYVGNVFPFIARLRDDRYIIVSGVRGTAQRGEVVVVDPSRGSLEFIFMGQSEFEELWDGQCFFVKKVYKVTDTFKPFGLDWFIPEMLRHKSMFRDVALATMTVNLLSVAFPIYIQLVFDKAVGHRALSTLVVLSVAILAMTIFEHILKYLKDYITIYATSKIDLRLDKLLYGHILRLPIDFFDFTPIGLITRYIFQKERVREFMTGTLLTTLFDMSLLVVVLPILFFYSWKLTFVVIAIALCITGIMFATMRVFRYKMHRVQEAEAIKNKYLVETLRGMGTIKSLALEPLRYKHMEADTANTISQHHSIKKLSIGVGTSSELLQGVMRIAILWYGCYLALDQEITIGGLIAFVMLSNMVTAPLVKMVGLLHEYQEVAVSVGLLGAILNRPVEHAYNARGLTSPISGSIGIESVTFRYAQNAPRRSATSPCTFPPARSSASWAARARASPP